MATDIRAGRNTPITSMNQLQKDHGLHAVTHQIAEYLATHPLPMVTLNDIADLLSSAGHAQVTTTGTSGWYEWKWDSVDGKWIRICHSQGIVSVRDKPNEDPIVVTVDDSAMYP